MFVCDLAMRVRAKRAKKYALRERNNGKVIKKTEFSSRRRHFDALSFLVFFLCRIETWKMFAKWFRFFVRWWFFIFGNTAQCNSVEYLVNFSTCECAASGRARWQHVTLQPAPCYVWQRKFLWTAFWFVGIMKLSLNLWTSIALLKKRNYVVHGIDVEKIKSVKSQKFLPFHRKLLNGRINSLKCSLQYILPRLNTHVDAGEIVRFISVTRSPLNPLRLLLSLSISLLISIRVFFIFSGRCGDTRERAYVCKNKWMHGK